MITSLFQILAILIIFVGTWLASWVYFSNPKSKVNRLFSLFTASFLLWAPLPYFFNLPQFSHISLFLVRLGYGMVSLFLVAFYFFAVYFPRAKKRYTILERIVLLLGIGFFITSICSDIVVESIEVTQWGVNPLFGMGKILYFSSAFFITVLSMILLFKKYLTLSQTEKTKIQYVFMGLTIFVVLNLISNVIFPFLGRTVQVRYYALGNYSAIFLLGFTAFAIVKKELFGIKVVLTQMLVGAIAILLLINFVSSETVFERVWKGVLFGMFLLFGYLLIRSVLQEIERREKMEGMAKDLRAAYRKLKKVDEAKTEFIAMASHQLRTPLTIVKGLSSMLLEGVYGKPGKEMNEPLEDIFDSNERLIDLVNDLLDISRVDLGKIELIVKEFDIVEMIAGVIKTLRPRAEKKGLKLIWEEFEEPLLIEADPIKVRQVILNIVDNAVKYTMEGQIRVVAKDLGAKVKITIKDTGEGLTSEEKEEIFESFTRGAAGLRFSIEGTGLGLYLAKKYVELHNGRVWAKSEGKGKGSSFYVELPKKKSAGLMKSHQ